MLEKNLCKPCDFFWDPSSRVWRLERVNGQRFQALDVFHGLKTTPVERFKFAVASHFSDRECFLSFYDLAFNTTGSRPEMWHGNYRDEDVCNQPPPRFSSLHCGLCTTWSLHVVQGGTKATSPIVLQDNTAKFQRLIRQLLKRSSHPDSAFYDLSTFYNWEQIVIKVEWRWQF